MSETFLISRADLAPIFGQNPRVLQQFEEMQRAVSDHGDAIGANVAATSSLADATFVTLSPNAELGNEYVLSVSEGLELLTGTGGVTLQLNAPVLVGGFKAYLTAQGDTNLVLPLTGVLATQQWVTAQGFSSGGAAAWGSITGTLASQTDLASALGGKQATLVSGTSIKTVNGSSLLGAGDLAAGGKIIASHEFDGTTSSWDSGALPTGYSLLQIEIYAKTAKSTATDAAKLSFNGDNASTNYPYVRISKAGSSAPAGASSTGAATLLVTVCGNAAGVANLFGHFIGRVPRPEQTNGGYKVMASEESWHDGTNYTTRNGTSWWKNTAAITSIQLASEAGDNFVNHSWIIVRGYP